MGPSTEGGGEEQVVIRNVVAADLPFVFSTWLKAMRYSAPFANGVKDHPYYIGQQRLIAGVLSRADTAIRVACQTADASVILGYACSEQRLARDESLDVVHFVYVKKPFRRLGIGRMLLASSVRGESFVFTQRTNDCEEIRRAGKLDHGSYNPYHAFFQEEDT